MTFKVQNCFIAKFKLIELILQILPRFVNNLAPETNTAILLSNFFYNDKALLNA